jgi:hypothetical protein
MTVVQNLNFWFNGDNSRTTGITNVKFCIETNNKYTNKLCITFCLQIKNYKHGKEAKF